MDENKEQNKNEEYSNLEKPEEESPQNQTQVSGEDDELPKDSEQDFRKISLPKLNYEIPGLNARFLIGFKGIELSSEMRKLLETYPVAGVIIFAQNYETPAQISELINELQEISLKQPWGRPMLIAVDHEGTTVTRFKSPFTIFPDPDAFGKLNSKSLVYEATSIMAKELKSVGINCNFAPVVDLNTNKKNPVIGKRSFGSDPEIVSRLVGAIIKAYDKNNLISVLKHFPGHGDTSVDSHEDLPTLNYTLAQLESRELIPFKNGFRAGVPCVMLAHLLIPAVDKLPVSLSKIWVNYLRNQMAFDGVIMSDDMEMGAILKYGNIFDSCMKSIDAGVDLLLINKEKTALELIPKMAKHTKFSQTEHLSSLQRLQWLFEAYFKDFSPIYIPELSRVFHRDHTLILKAIQDGTGKTLQDWKNVRELPYRNRVQSSKENYQSFIYEESSLTSVALTAPGGRLPEDILNQNSGQRKPHRDSLTVPQGNNSHYRERQNSKNGDYRRKNNSNKNPKKNNRYYSKTRPK